MQHIPEESPFYQELVEYAREEAREKGREEGREEGLAATVAGLRRFLVFRYNVADDYFDARLRLLDLSVLQQLFNVVADTSALAKFEEILAQFVTQAQTVQADAQNRQVSATDPSI